MGRLEGLLPAALLAVVVLAVWLLAGCDALPSADPSRSSTPSTQPTSSSPTVTPTQAVAAPRPRPGSCYRLTYDDAVAPTTHVDPSPCRGPHTSVAHYVGTLDTFVDGHLLAVDSDRVQQQVSTDCPRRFAAYVGGTVEQRRLSLLRSVWFTPTLAEADKGAGWYRCDVIAIARDGQLAPLAGTLRGVLDSAAGQDRYGLCGTARPGTSGFHRVICNDDHSWRAIRTVAFEPGKYPGLAKVRAAGNEPCKDAGRDAADDELDYAWGYEWPTANQWSAGQTYGFCWAPD